MDNNELYHFGIKGMKWGKRKAKTEYQDTKKEYRAAKKDFYKIKNNPKNLLNYKKSQTDLKKARNKVIDTEIKSIDAAVKYKTSGIKNKAKAEKVAQKLYAKKMSKSGDIGSVADFSSGNRSTKIYNHIKKQKGKVYADEVLRREQNKTLASVTASSIALGSLATLAIINR